MLQSNSLCCAVKAQQGELLCCFPFPLPLLLLIPTLRVGISSRKVGFGNPKKRERSNKKAYFSAALLSLLCCTLRSSLCPLQHSRAAVPCFHSTAGVGISKAAKDKGISSPAVLCCAVLCCRGKEAANSRGGRKRQRSSRKTIARES